MTDDLPVPVDPPASQPGGVDRKMLESLVCPVTQRPLDYDREAQELISRSANFAFPIRDGIPIMLVEEARALD
ncbi:MAG: Trm112 family protein [Pseudomonadota bacterium]